MICSSSFVSLRVDIDKSYLCLESYYRNVWLARVFFRVVLISDLTGRDVQPQLHLNLFNPFSSVFICGQILKSTFIGGLIPIPPPALNDKFSGNMVTVVTVGRAAAIFGCMALLASAGQRDMGQFLGLGTPPDPAAVKAGEPLYQQNCAACHGQNARGAEGPNLTRSAVVLHDEKGEEIAQVVKNGRPQAGMPAFPALKPQEIYQIAEYIHQQVFNAANRGLYSSLYANQRSQTSGDPKKGEEFFTAHCATCHSATGDLAHIALKYPQAAMMQARFLWPARKGPGEATVKTASGETVKGTVIRLDDFDVALRDSNGDYHHWPRDQVTVQADDPLAGHRALLPTYTDSDIHNITAYLLTLK